MTIVVTGATGPLGRHVVESLLARGVPADQILATGRAVEKIQDLGVRAQRADYNSPEELKRAFDGAEKVLFVSSSEAGRRIAQHTNVVEAATAAGVGLLLYTSIANAGTSDLILAGEHQATEELIKGSGLPYAFLRNSWYYENYDFRGAVQNGVYGAAGNGRISAAARADYAEAAAAAVVRGAGRVYELGGPGFTLAELAAEIAKISGTEVTYTDLAPEKYQEFLLSVGLPEPAAVVLSDADRGAAQGALEVDPADMRDLLGRPAKPVADAIRAALA
ncbi:NAD(P)H-binding protein [Actinoplanes sp. NPDC051633]|uniref:NAD(P)H-binding protein n=1 Tax=Actinoplanes sp. NPDC051633 TaxID=3155670 RepID=UPI00342B99A6